MQSLAHLVGQHAQLEQIAVAQETDRLVAREPVARQDLPLERLRDGHGT
jgi:hypothetical protein